MTEQPPHPFTPFSPSPPIAPDQPKIDAPTGKKPRKAKGDKVVTAIVVKNDGSPPEVITKPARKPRVTKAKALKGHSSKFDLQTTLAAAQILKEDDFPMFEKLVVMLDEAGKPARDRVLSALGKVFG